MATILSLGLHENYTKILKQATKTGLIIGVQGIQGEVKPWSHIKEIKDYASFSRFRNQRHFPTICKHKYSKFYLNKTDRS